MTLVNRMTSAYPKTASLLGVQLWGEVLQEFVSIWGEEGDESWLPSLLLNLEVDEDVLETAQLERIYYWLPRAELEARGTSVGLALNPSLQILPLRRLRPPGVYAFWIGLGPSNESLVQEKTLLPLEAQIIDLLREDLVWTLHSLSAHLESMGKKGSSEVLAQFIRWDLVRAPAV